MVTLILFSATSSTGDLRCSLNENPECALLEGLAGEGLTEQVARLNPDIVVLELPPDDPYAVWLVRRLTNRFPATQVLALVPAEAAELAQWALRAGARGCLIVETAAGEIGEALAALQAGHFYLSRSLWDRVVDEYTRPPRRQGPARHTYGGDAC